MKKNTESIKILDCTFRDGGYYCKWKFPLEIINQYFASINLVGVDVVEIGYRSLKTKKVLGPCAYSNDDFLAQIDNPTNLKIAAMINGYEIIEDDYVSKLKRLFPNTAANTPLSIVRIASSFENIKRLNLPIEWLKKRGFSVFVNITHSHELSEKDIIQISNSLYNCDVIYFADSLGCITSDKIKDLISIIKVHVPGEIGFHAHDNFGLALSNSLKAIQYGCNWIDSTILGMGRGAGNTKTELLALEISQYRNKEYLLVDLQNLIETYFKKLKKKYEWGTNIFYYQSAKNNIHPTYVQKMISDKSFKVHEIFSVINFLKNNEAKSFDIKRINFVSSFFKGKLKGSWKPASLLKNKEVLFIGPCPISDKLKSKIYKFAKNKNLIVIALNAHNSVKEEFIDYRIACNPFRLIADLEKHINLEKPLITPASMLSEEIRSKLSKKILLDFGLRVLKSQFQFFESKAILPSSKVIAYALAVSASGKVKKIYFAGFDGFSDNDIRANEVEEIIDLFNKSEMNIEIISLTKTKFNIPDISIT